MAVARLQEQFDEAMFEIYRRAKAEANYNASRFLAMLEERGGLATARALIHAPRVSEGFEALWERKRLDLTVEAVILKDPWRQLFDESELEIARQRLRDLGYALS